MWAKWKSDFDLFGPNKIQFFILVCILWLGWQCSESWAAWQWVNNTTNSATAARSIWIEKPTKQILLDITHGNNCVCCNLPSNRWHKTLIPCLLVLQPLDFVFIYQMLSYIPFSWQKVSAPGTDWCASGSFFLTHDHLCHDFEGYVKLKY